jgi:acyl-CoA synthetase (AMP-forming)/AMP-acid ligase II
MEGSDCPAFDGIENEDFRSMSGKGAIVHAQGCGNIIGRLEDMAIRGGENASPREIGECLYLHPKAEDVVGGDVRMRSLAGRPREITLVLVCGFPRAIWPRASQLLM